MEKRVVRSKRSIEVDFTKPIDKEAIMSVQDDCFGKHWDLRTKECPICADRDICCILTKDKVDAKAKDIEQEQGSRYLDEADMDSITDKKLLSFIKSGETTIRELLEHAADLGNLDDVVAIKSRVVAFIKGTDGVSVKGGIVYVK